MLLIARVWQTVQQLVDQCKVVLDVVLVELKRDAQ